MKNLANDFSDLIIKKLLDHPKVPRDINEDSRIVEDLSFDSLAIMNFVMEIEDELDVSLPLDRLTETRTIRDLAKCLAQIKNGSP